MKFFGNFLSFVILSVSLLFINVNCIPISISTISLINDGSTMVDLTNDEILVISMKEVPMHVSGSIDARTGSFQLTAQHE